MPRASSVKLPAKANYAALFAGWQELTSFPTNGLPSVDSTIRAVLANKSSTLPAATVVLTSSLPRLTLGVSRKGLKVIQAAPLTGGRRRNRNEKVRHAWQDILCAVRGVDTDVLSAVACVLHGFNEATHGWLHVCVYWFDDGRETADRFLRHILNYIDTPKHRSFLQQLEVDMLTKGQIKPVANGNAVVSSACLGDAGLELGSPAAAGNGVGHNPAAIWSADDPTLGAVPLWPLQGPSQYSAVWVSDNATNPQDHQRDNHDHQHHHQQQQQQLVSPMNQLKVDDSNCFAGNFPPANSRLSSAFDVDQLPPDYDDDDVTMMTSGPSLPIAVPAPVASLAGELKNKFGRGAPILLPPKDYDTVNRTRGNLLGIESRRCQNFSIVGSAHSSSVTSADDGQSRGSSVENVDPGFQF